MTHPRRHKSHRVWCMSETRKSKLLFTIRVKRGYAMCKNTHKRLICFNADHTDWINSTLAHTHWHAHTYSHTQNTHTKHTHNTHNTHTTHTQHTQARTHTRNNSCYCALMNRSNCRARNGTKKWQNTWVAPLGRCMAVILRAGQSTILPTHTDKHAHIPHVHARVCKCNILGPLKTGGAVGFYCTPTNTHLTHRGTLANTRTNTNAHAPHIRTNLCM